MSQLLVHPKLREPEETNARTAMGCQPCRGAKHTEGIAQLHRARARGAGDRGKAMGMSLWPYSRVRPG